MPGVLYKREREVLEFIAQFQKHYGYSPKLHEIAEATSHKANSTVHALIASLVDKGYIQKVEGNNRILKILDPKIAESAIGNAPSIELPLMGYIAAGKPLEPHSDPNATFQVSASMISGKKVSYVLQVKGNSMIEDGILDGDYAIIERTDIAQNGDIVVAIVDDNLATLKRYYKEGGKVILKPANREMDPIYPTQLVIQGRCTGIVRKFI